MCCANTLFASVFPVIARSRRDQWGARRSNPPNDKQVSPPVKEEQTGLPSRQGGANRSPLPSKRSKQVSPPVKEEQTGLPSRQGGANRSPLPSRRSKQVSPPVKEEQTGLPSRHCEELQGLGGLAATKQSLHTISCTIPAKIT